MSWNWPSREHFAAANEIHIFIGPLCVRRRLGRLPRLSIYGLSHLRTWTYFGFVLI